jgi:hypothetical protein
MPSHFVDTPLAAGTHASGTLASALGAHAGRIARQPRVSVDANVPAGLVGFMRDRLLWDTLLVVAHDDLRRARDVEHYRMARQRARTSITLDGDDLDDVRFPPAESGGLVLCAPDAGALMRLLARFDAGIFRGPGTENGSPGDEDRAPLAGRKMHLHADWRRT